MHEGRNTAATMLLVIAIIWAFFVWLAAPALGLEPAAPLVQKAASLLAIAIVGGFVVYAISLGDRLDDPLARATAGHYFERDGLCFMPLTRVVQTPDGPQAEISLYYQSRYDRLCEAVVHIRPPDGAFLTHDGARTVRFVFRCAPGAFGVVHQPVGVAPGHQGTTVEADLAAAVRWPRGHGEQLRPREGAHCGRIAVDWTSAFQQAGPAGEIELKKPARIHLSLPEQVSARAAREQYVNETLAGL